MQQSYCKHAEQAERAAVCEDEDLRRDYLAGGKADFVHSLELKDCDGHISKMTSPSATWAACSFCVVASNV